MKCFSAVFGVALDWLFEEVDTIHHSASQTCCHSAANETPRHGRDSRSHCDARGENDLDRSAPGGFSCLAESNGTSSPYAVECDSLTTAFIGYRRVLGAQSSHFLQLPVAARSTAPIVVAPGHSTSPQPRALAEHEQLPISPDPARFRSARHQMVSQESRLPKRQMRTLPTDRRQ